MTRPITLILAALALAIAVPAAAQEGTLKKIKDGGSITIGHRDASIPFSYYDDKQQPVGYAVELCLRIVDAVKSELKMPKLDVKYQLVTSANRIPLMANGTIDLECGPTTYSLAAQSRNPGDYAISTEATSVEPYGIMLRKDDAAFKKVVNAAMTNIYKSGQINAIYEKWFLKPIPPKGINLNIPMSDQFKRVVANPTDSGDPAAYK